MKKIMTIEDLVRFCSENQMYSFDSKECGHQVFVQVPATFETHKSDEYTLYGKVKLLHTGKNRNGSLVTVEAANKCKKKLQYKPLLANFCEIDGVKDFTSHDIKFDDDGNPVEYLEHQIGCFTADEPYLEYDEKKDRYYLYGYVAIPREYTDAADIIERKEGTKVSAELSISKWSYDVDAKALSLDEFEVTGATCLGTDPETGAQVNEGMEGARLDILDFSQSVADEKLIDVIQGLKESLDNYISAFSANNSKEGGEQHMFEELLEKYGKSVDEITFEYENLTDEELVAAFAEAFSEIENEVETEVEAEVETENEVEDEAQFNYSLTATLGENTKTFSVNLSDVIYALTELVNDTYTEDGTYYCVSVFDGSTNKERYVIMQDWYTGTAYKQSYKVKDGNYSLAGERIQVYSVWVTAEERDQLETMKANYSDMSEKLEKYEAEPEKMNIIENECYAQIANTEDFVSLKNNHFDLSIQDVQNKADEMLLNYAKQGKIEINSGSMVNALPVIPSKKGKINKYGNLFSENK